MSHPETPPSKITIDKIRRPAKVSPDRNAEHEQNTLEQDNKDKESNRKLREGYATRVYRYLIAYTMGCAIIVMLSGWMVWGFDIPDAALVVIVGSTAISAIGLVGIVAKGLFKGP